MQMNFSEIDMEFANEIDEINDKLTQFCEKTFEDYNDVIKYVELGDQLLQTKGLHLHQDDIESLRSSLEDPKDEEAINYIIPVYRDDEQSEYNLSVTYYQETDISDIEMDMELQYEWEADMEDEEDFEEYDN